MACTVVANSSSTILFLLRFSFAWTRDLAHKQWIHDVTCRPFFVHVLDWSTESTGDNTTRTSISWLEPKYHWQWQIFYYHQNVTSWKLSTRCKDYQTSFVIEKKWKLKHFLLTCSRRWHVKQASGIRLFVRKGKKLEKATKNKLRFTSNFGPINAVSQSSWTSWMLTLHFYVDLTNTTTGKEIKT